MRILEDKVFLSSNRVAKDGDKEVNIEGEKINLDGTMITELGYRTPVRIVINISKYSADYILKLYTINGLEFRLLLWMVRFRHPIKIPSGIRCRVKMASNVKTIKVIDNY